MKICIDFHGVLTDGKLNIAHDGTMFESCHVRDVRAIRELVARGYEVYIVTASDSRIIETFCDKVGCERIIMRDKSQIPFDDYIAVGDDVYDIAMLTKAKKAFCPFDADQAVLSLSNIQVLNTRGGKGVIAELVRGIL